MEWKKISGKLYDWKLTGKPEQPYIHDYSHTLTMKLGLSIPDRQGVSQVFCTFEQALDVIKTVDRITLGYPKIVYLVGWQYGGHDDKYPAWFSVNEALKGADDATALESLKRLMKEARKFNTTVSLHINMTDAYKDSPLWDEYREKGLIAKKRNGKPMKIGTWNHKTAYQVCYSREWESGYSVKRIDRLLEMLPLKEAGTVHIDAFFCRRNPGENISKKSEQENRRRIIRYWRSRGVDVTSEFLYRETGFDDLIGLVPMVWWLKQKQKDYLERPASLLCGGSINPDLHGDQKLRILFGENMQGENVIPNYKQRQESNQWKGDVLRDFCLRGLPWQFLNNHKRISVSGFGLFRKALYSDDITVYLRKNRLLQGDVIYRDGDDLFIPLPGREEHEILVYSRKGYLDKSWILPPSWEGSNTVHSRSWDSGIEQTEGHRKKVYQVEERRILLTLSPGCGLILTTGGTLEN